MPFGIPGLERRLELANRTDTAERYVREWLNAQAASGYVDYDADTARYSMSAEQAMAFADETSPAFLARHVREALAPNGTWLLVEPKAGDRVEDNLHPVGRFYYAASTLMCTPNALSQDGATALGAQAGEHRLREIATAAGFTRFRRAAETPLNLVLEAQP